MAILTSVVLKAKPFYFMEPVDEFIQELNKPKQAIFALYL